ncbi:S8 family serine peptidase [Janibacter sp. UYMM211]|uniref:S8 family peptidase n=1 Tax=Janibacter sp. UYMM211 TaxID=3156342 RepID=UPI0033992A18
MASTRKRTTPWIVATAAIGLTLVGSQSAAGSSSAAEPPSTPVPVSTPDGQLASYVVNAKIVNPGQVRKVEKAVEAAGGVVVQSWPQIGVVVAHSKNGDFRTEVVTKAKGAVASAGPTRTAAVLEGTPEGVQAPWGPGKGQIKAIPRAEDPVEGPTTPATGVPEQYESLQWDMKNIGVPEAHKTTTGSSKVTVGVLDSGIDPDHPDLASQIDVAQSVNCTAGGRPDTSATGWAPTTSDHGTHVAGTIGAARNGVGIVGVAPGVKMASVKVVSDEGYIYPEYAICGFMWAGEKGMEVTNNSYYVDPFEFWCGDQPEQAPALEAVRRAVKWSQDEGTVHVAAAGNSSYDLSNKTTNASSPNDGTAVNRTINSSCKDIPTELDDVLTVSSIDQAGKLSSFSNRGLGSIDVAAPGSRILSTIVTNNGWGYKSGTSMASPHVAGVVALMRSAHPELSASQVVERIRAQATDTPCSTTAAGAPCVGDASENSYYGQGVVDAAAAVR